MALGFLETLRPTREGPSSNVAQRNGAASATRFSLDSNTSSNDQAVDEQRIVRKPDVAYTMGSEVDEEKVGFLSRPSQDL